MLIHLSSITLQSKEEGLTQSPQFVPNPEIE